MHKLAIGAVVKNEAPYIDEWITFHVLHGVDHFYLYDNASTDETRSILQLYEAAGVVTWEPLNIRPVQFKAYNKCLKDYGKDNEWIAFLDCDEFLYSPTKKPLPSLLDTFSKGVGAVTPHWVFYGSSGELTKQEGLVTKRFRYRSRLPDKHVKSIVRPRLTVEVGKNPHYFLTNGSTVDEKGAIREGFYGLKEGGTIDVLRINHYHTKSKEEYFIRKTLGDPGTAVIHPPERVTEMFRAHDLNEVLDTSAEEYSEAVEELIQDFYA